MSLTLDLWSLPRCSSGPIPCLSVQCRGNQLKLQLPGGPSALPLLALYACSYLWELGRGLLTLFLMMRAEECVGLTMKEAGIQRPGKGITCQYYY